MTTKPLNRTLILAVESAKLPFANGYAQQFLGLSDSGQLTFMLEQGGLWLGPRYILEDDPRFSQLIPYTVVKIGGKVLAYTRTHKGEESRLHALVSVGVGGHVEFADVICDAGNDDKVDLAQTLYYAAIRELDEELGAGASPRPWPLRLAGLLATRGTPVGDVHLGVVHVCELEALPSDVEDTLGDVRALSIDELSNLNEQGRLEPWTAALLPFLASF